MPITIDGTGTISGISVGGLPDATITQAELATPVAGTGPAFNAYLSANQSVTSGVATKVALNTEEFDTNGNYDNVTNYRFTPTVAGYYQLNLNLLGYSSTSQISQLSTWLYKNGSVYTYLQVYNSPIIVTSVSLSTIVYANGTTDYFEMYGVMSGSNLFFGGNTERTTNFSGTLVRAS
jgi:hypothetical protein